MRRLTEQQSQTLRDCIYLCDEYVRLGQQLQGIEDNDFIKDDPTFSGLETLHTKVDTTIDTLCTYNSLFARHIAGAAMKKDEKLTLQYMDEILAKQSEEYDQDKAQADYYEECAAYDQSGPEAE